MHTEVRQQNSSSFTTKSSPSPLIGSDHEVNTIKLLKESLPNIISELNKVKDNWGQNYSTIVVVLSDIDQVRVRVRINT